MSANFQIESRTSNGDLHLKPRGDFDGSSALELLNLIRSKYDGTGRVFIDTKHLHHICPFGCDTFRFGLNLSLMSADHIFFKGEKGFDIAPNGSKVIVASKKHESCGNCKNCSCSAKKKLSESGGSFAYAADEGQSGRHHCLCESCGRIGQADPGYGACSRNRNQSSGTRAAL